MNSCAIICEYNPMHLGHIYHIKKTLDDLRPDILIAIMSGNFIQRGGLSILDKYKRAKICLENGFDLVIELPPQFAISSAEHFAFGAISLINNLSIDYVSFGSECGELDPLIKMAKFLKDEPLEYRQYLKSFLNEGLPYHTCRKNALAKYLNSDDINLLNTSNNILSIEYLKNLLKLNSNTKPYTIKRKGASYTSLDLKEEFPSASSIRNHLNLNKDIFEIKNAMTQNSFNSLLNFYNEYHYFIKNELIFPYLKYKSLTLENKLMLLPDCSEGIHNKILKSIIKSNSLEESILEAKSKRYTYTRISRLLSQYFIGFENFPIKDMLNEEVTCAKILGFNDRGKYFLNKNRSNILYSSINKNEHSKEKLLNVQCTKAYSMINKDVDPFEDYLKHPIIF
ncbi:MAG: nucleotidyltransferase [Oscillospiraceae bacterium]|nr:nucleotidyltransferase [Oscillospiraceae bacterium]